MMKNRIAPDWKDFGKAGKDISNSIDDSARYEKWYADKYIIPATSIMFGVTGIIKLVPYFKNFVKTIRSDKEFNPEDDRRRGGGNGMRVPAYNRRYRK